MKAYSLQQGASSSRFITVTLQGGTHDGQHVNVPEDQQTIELVEAGKRRVYHRTGPRPIFYHADELARQFGGRK